MAGSMIRGNNMLISKFRLLGLALFGLFLSSCGGGGGGGSSSPDISNNACGTLGLNPKVINGTVCSGLSQSPVVRVFAAFQDGNIESCSGTMLTPTRTLTAAHCVVDFSNLSNRPKFLAVAAGDPGSIKVVEAVSFVLHRGLRPEVINGETNIFNDIAVINLGSSVNVPIMPILTSTGPIVGDIVQIFGYGQSTPGQLPPPSSLQEFVDSSASLRSGEMILTSITNNHLRAEALSGKSMVCHGDSGGPLVFTYNGEPTIVGVTSELLRQTGEQCDTGSIAQWTRIQSSEVLSGLLALVPNAQTR